MIEHECRRRTVSENKFGNPGNVHRDAAKEIVITTQPNKRLRSHCALKAAQNEDSRCVWDQEADEAEKCWVRLQGVSFILLNFGVMTYQTALQDRHDEELMAGRRVARIALD